MKAELHTLRGDFIEASDGAMNEEELYSLAGWWAFQGFDLEYACLRTREDDSDIHLVIARRPDHLGRVQVVAVLTMIRPGAKEWGWV